MLIKIGLDEKVVDAIDYVLKAFPFPSKL